MNWDQVDGQWKQLQGRIKSKWAKLTDDDLMHLSAKKDDLVGKVQERYGIMKDAAEAQVDEWLRELRHSDDESPSTRVDRPGSPPARPQGR